MGQKNKKVTCPSGKWSSHLDPHAPPSRTLTPSPSPFTCPSPTHLDLQAVQGGPGGQSDARSGHTVLIADMNVPHQHLQVLGEMHC